jgi:Fusaric acid resistance protein-like
LWLVLIIATLQFTVEMLIVRNYTLAAVFITPLALTIASGGHRVDDVGGLLFARGMDTLIGCVLALVVYLVVGRRQKPWHVPEAVARVLDAVAATSHHIAIGAVSTESARAARRDLQIRAIAMLAAYEAGIDGTPRERRSAERMWPAVVATEQLAYRTLRCCWSMDRDADSEAAGDIRRSLFGPNGADQFTSTLGELATAVRHGSTTHDLGRLPLYCAAELTSLRDSLVRDTD